MDRALECLIKLSIRISCRSTRHDCRPTSNPDRTADEIRGEVARRWNEVVPASRAFSGTLRVRRNAMRALFLCIALLAAAAAPLSGQAPEATVTPFVEADGVRAGTPIRVALTVSLPEGLHVQSDKPRDPSLIATTLTIDAPAGIKVTNLVFPHPTDFTVEGQAQPLAVFDREFVVGAELELDAGVRAGELTVPARLRYQACNDKVCFRPMIA